MPGTLYIVATPIGNLKDISQRALTILGAVDFIMAEDTRRTKQLLDRYELSTQLVSLHQHSNVGKIDHILSKVTSGQIAALVTDAGTPGIADPGGIVVAAALEKGITIIPVPGPSALGAILSVTPWQNEPTLFIGYLPKKKGRQTLLTAIKNADKHLVKTVVLYESPERIGRTLNELLEYCNPDSQVTIGRELTKQFEEILHGSLQELANRFQNKKGQTVKGEFVLAINLSAVAHYESE